MFHKSYFEKGEGLIAYGKWFILYFAAATMDISSSIAYGIAYAAIAYAVGRIYFSKQFMEAENEVNNLMNRFMKEVRRDLLNNGGKKMKGDVNG